MDRSCFITQEDEDGVTHELEVHYFVNQRDVEGDISIVLKSVTENDIQVEMDAVMVAEITELCMEDYDDEQWEYQED